MVSGHTLLSCNHSSGLLTASNVVSHELESKFFKRGLRKQGIIWRIILGVINGDTRNLDYGSHGIRICWER